MRSPAEVVMAVGVAPKASVRKRLYWASFVSWNSSTSTCFHRRWYEVGDPRGKHTRFARAGPGDEEGVLGGVADDPGLEGIGVIGPERGGGFLLMTTR
eukprot:evm.model.NODE_19166_length_72781_cov_34.074345.8